MPKTAAKFGQDVQFVLQGMVLKPSAIAGLAVSLLLHNKSLILLYTRLYKKPCPAYVLLFDI